MSKKTCESGKTHPVSSDPDLIEVSVQEAAGQVWGPFHQLEEAHKVVAVDCSKCLDGKLHLRGITYLITKLLHFTVQKYNVRMKCMYFFATQSQLKMYATFSTLNLLKKKETHVYTLNVITTDLINHLWIWPQDVAIVEFQQHAVLAKLRLPEAVGVTCCQVLVHFFETL